MVMILRTNILRKWLIVILGLLIGVTVVSVIGISSTLAQETISATPVIISLPSATPPVTEQTAFTPTFTRTPTPMGVSLYRKLPLNKAGLRIEEFWYEMVDGRVRLGFDVGLQSINDRDVFREGPLSILLRPGIRLVPYGSGRKGRTFTKKARKAVDKK